MSEGAQKKQEKQDKPRKFQAIRGTRDLLPPETELWNHVDQTARQVFSTFGYGEIRPPIFEPTELFSRAVGVETDIVRKEMFWIDDELEGEAGERLEFLRLQIQYQSTSSPQGPDIAEFKKLYAEFIDRYKAALASGLAYRNEFTERHLVFIEKNLERLSQLPTEIRNQTEQFFFDETIDHCKTQLAELALTEPKVLRPEATASVCRAYIEHNMQQWPQPVKLYYIGPMFRRERPQKGRYRQFYQIGAEILETARPDTVKDATKELAKDAAVDAEVIEMLMTFFERVGLQGTELTINSIGHSAPPVDGKNVCRRAYVELLREELRKVKDQLGADSQRRIETNPLRVLDSKLEHEQPIIAKLPHIADHLCDECKTHYAELRRQLDLRGVKYKENWRLVRGIDYYMRTTFEITARGLGSQDSVCGGGRYDGLVELLGGPPTKGIGFAIGEDRVILSLQEQKKEVASRSATRDAEGASGEWRVASVRAGIDVYVAWMGEKAYETALRAAKTLRSAGFAVEVPFSELKFGKALERASKLNARFALILGENEVQSGEWTLKNLADGSQQKFTEAALLEYLRKL